MLTRLIVGIFSLIALAVVTLCVVYGEVILAALFWLAVGVGLFLVGAAGITLWVGIERALGEREKRRHLSGGLTITNEFGFFVYKDGAWLQLHQMPHWRVNGKETEPTPAELATYGAYLASRGNRARLVEQPAAVGLLGPGTESIPDILPILDRAQRVLIKAESDGGKTTLLQHIASRRNGAVLVLDPHSYPDKWPAKCTVIGAGSNHAEISKMLDKLIEIMLQRYKEIGAGLVKEGEHPRLTIIVDEWMSIAHECTNASSVMVRLLTESRKAAFSIFVGSHSERVRSLGLDGRGDLKDGFLFVRIFIENGERTATYDYGRGERPCLLPGRYDVESTGPIFEIEPGAVEVEEEPSGPNIDTDRVLELFDSGEATTPSAIALKLVGYKNKDVVGTVRAILIEHGRLG